MTDDETVYVAAGCDRYHESRECQGLSHAREIAERPLTSLPTGFTLCQLCSGSYQPDPSDGPFVTASLLEELDPDDVE